MKLKVFFSRIFFPERCEICGNIKPFLCSYCPSCGIDSKAIPETACPNCGHEKCMCHTKAYTPLPHFSAVYYYEGQIKRSLLKFKFYGESFYGDIFGKAMADRIKALYGDRKFDGICFVPMTDKAQLKRGYNQSELLALKISEELNIPLVPCLRKLDNSLNQKNLSAEERIKNVRDSFEVKSQSDIKDKTLILCDDIKTTGCTLKECSDTLLKAGAKDVYCICLAITPYYNNTDIF
jgi:ComF family protein